VAQKISSIVDMDKIIVLKNGSVDAIGDHKYLLENCKTYIEIFESQKDSGGAKNEK